MTTGAKAFADAAGVVINGTNDGPVVTFDTKETPAAVLNGFTIQGGHTSAQSTLNGGGISITQASPTITNNIVTNNLGCGIHVINGASPLIQGNDIKGNSGPLDHLIARCTSAFGDGGQGNGISLSTAGNVQIIGNTIEENLLDEVGTSSQACGAGVFIFKGTQILLQNNIIRNNHAACFPGLTSFEPPGNLLLIQNLIYGNTSLPDRSPQQVILKGITSAPYTSLTETNNTIAGQGGGETITFAFAPSTIANNIFVNFNSPGFFGNGLAGLHCTNPASQNSASFYHNDIFNNGVLIPTTCPTGAGSLAVDPQFLNPATGDFHTQPSSPVVAAGDINAPLIPPADLDQKARTVCNTIDMGIYEIRPHPPIALTASPNPTPGRSAVTLTATLTGNCNVPTGLVTFLDGVTVLGTAPISGSSIATFTTSFLFVGTHIITATYPGDFNFEGSTSNAITEVITGPPTMIVLNSVTPNPTQPLQPLTMTATVRSAYTIPSGMVTFMTGGKVLATAPIAANGSASGGVSTLGAGTYPITAVYSGSTEYAASTSNIVTEIVLGADAMTSLTAAPSPVVPGQTVTFTAKVTSSVAAVAVAGTVTFKDGALTLGTGSVGANGIATFGTAGLLTGTHSIAATYSGSQNLNVSVSPPLLLVVTALPTSLGLSVSPNPSSIGHNVTMNATVVASVGNQVPAGTVTFADQAGILSTSPLTAGVAFFATTTLSPGTHQITATFNPIGPFAPSSATVAEVINDFNFTVTTAPSSTVIPSGDYQILDVTITPSGGFSRAVNLSCSSLPVHAQCSFTPTTTLPLSNGTQTVKLLLGTSDVLGYRKQVGKLTEPKRPLQNGTSSSWAALFFPFLALCGIAGGSSRYLNSVHRKLFLLIAMCGLGLSLTACSGKLPGATPPGSYAVTVTASDTDTTTGLVHTATLNLQVTP